MPSAPPKRRPLRGVLDDLLEAEPMATATAQVSSGVPVAERRPAAIQQRFTINLPAAIIERARDAVYHSPDLTLASLTTAALERELDRLERERGEPFPARSGPLRLGRPVR